jgi:hypothetical protein
MPDTTDIFHWKMSAADHRSAVNELRRLILEARAQQSPLPIEAIVKLLPLTSNQLDEAAARGDITFNGDTWINEADDDLWMEFEDNVLQTFSVTIPRVWTGRLQVDGETITIFFEVEDRELDLELEIPRLAEMGVSRSSFQKAISIFVDQEVSLTILRECGDTGRDTWIEAQLQDEVVREFQVPSEVTNYSTFDSVEIVCPWEEQEREWYVYRRDYDQPSWCVVHKGEYNTGGVIAYRLVAGPMTKAEADAYERDNCEGGAGLCS